MYVYTYVYVVFSLILHVCIIYSAIIIIILSQPFIVERGLPGGAS